MVLAPRRILAELVRPGCTVVHRFVRLFASAVILLSLPFSGHTSDLALTHTIIYTQPDRPPITDGTILIHSTIIEAVGRTGSIKLAPNVHKYLAMFHISMPEVHSIPETRARVDQQIREGADGVKIFAGSIEAGHVEIMPVDLAGAIVAEAHRYNKLVFSHPSTIRGIEVSLEAGADILAHVTTSETNEAGTTWPPELVARMKGAHMSLIPTLTLFDSEMQKGHASAHATQQVIALAVSQLHAYNSAGGQILFGTDIGYIDH